MGLVGILPKLAKCAKTRYVSDLALLVLVRHAASFGHIVHFGAKTRCVSDKMSESVPTPRFRGRLTTSFGLGSFRHGIWVKSVVGSSVWIRVLDT